MLGEVGGGGILTAIQRKSIQSLREILNIQVTLISGITWALHSKVLGF
jgi:hypothetical protein